MPDPLLGETVLTLAGTGLPGWGGSEVSWRLDDPMVLVLLALLPLAGGWLVRRRTVAFSCVRMFARPRPSWRQRLARSSRCLRSAVFVIVVLALARPRLGTEPIHVTTVGSDIALILDRSSSMRGRDLDPDRRRFDVACDVLAGFVRHRPDDRMALVTFARTSRLACPLTTDREALLSLLARTELAELDSDTDGTAIGVALAQVARTLEFSKSAAKIAILLTDGENNENAITPAEGAAWCRTAGVKVYVVAVGSVQEQLAGEGNRQAAGVSPLELIARTTGGQLYEARDASSLRAIYARIDALEKSELEDHVVYASWREAAWPLLAAALLMLGIDVWLRWGVARSLP